MLKLPQQMRDGELFRELPDLTRPMGREGHGLSWDGSFADSYIRRVQEVRLSCAQDGDSPHRQLEQFVLDYLAAGKPIRRFPSSTQTFRTGDEPGEYGELDYFAGMEEGGRPRSPGGASGGCYLNEYRRMLERWNRSLRYYQPFLKNQNTLSRALLRFALAAVPLAGAAGVFLTCPLEPLRSLLTLLLVLTGVFFLTRWSASLTYRTVLTNYRRALERDGQLLAMYRYVRFCQLWCTMEGRHGPEALDRSLHEINLAMDNYRRIVRFYPELG